MATTPVIDCPWCGRPTRKRPRHGRRTFSHKCPHGNWCPRADPLRQHDNNYPPGGRGWCAECHRIYWEQEKATRGVRPVKPRSEWRQDIKDRYGDKEDI
jgi:hypothetical protein